MTNIRLPQTLALLRVETADEDLEEALLSELSDQAINLLDESTSSGGWPDEPLVSVEALARHGKGLRADISVAFKEIIPSSCADLPHREEQKADFVLTLNGNSEIPVINRADTDPTQWDLWDRNSAADGA
jgi:hypothetical protein